MRLHTRGVRFAAVGLGLCLGGCGPVEDVRAGWLRHTLVLDNQVFLERAPELTGGKLALMGEQLYPFFRGTAPQYARDTLQPGGPGHRPSRFVSAHNRDVLLVGDPHPENIGTYRGREGAIVVEFNDFDASTYGPFTFDLRRLALGFWIAGLQIEAWTPTDAAATLVHAHREAAVEALVEAYVEAIDGGSHDGGTVIADLREKAQEDGDAQEKLLDYTEVDGARRSMRYGDLEPARVVVYGEHEQLVLEDSVRPLPEAEQRMLEAMVTAYQAETGIEGELLGLSRRYGSGVSSYPQLRYYVLLSGPSDDPLDDVLLEAKETVDAVPLPGLTSLPSWIADSNGARVVFAQQTLHGGGDNDPYLGEASTPGGQSFRFRHRTAYQRGVRVSRIADKLAEGEWQPQDFVDYAAFAGALLARTHARGTTQRGTSSQAAITEAVQGEADALSEETLAFVLDYAPVVERDAERLGALLEVHGTQLGY